MTEMSVVVALDGSEESLRALLPAVTFASAHQCTVVAVRVLQDGEGEADVESWLGSHATGAATTVVGRVERGDPADLIIDVVAEDPGGVVCMATRGRGPVRAGLFGSVSASVVRRSPVPVVLVGPAAAEGAGSGVRRLVVPVDTPAAGELLEPVITSWAAALGVGVRLVHVIYPLVDPVTRATILPWEVKEMYRYLSEARDRLAADGIDAEYKVIEATDTAAAIVEQAEIITDTWVLMATHGRSHLAEIWMGSVTAETVRRCPTPVVVVNPSATVDPGSG